MESRQAIEQADKVLYLVSDPISEIWIKKTNPNSESLGDCYAQGKHRMDIYKGITEYTLKYVREGLNVCEVYYGHPGIFVMPSHQSIRQARAEGSNARMLPGISAEDCLFADLGIDPSTHGCQSFEATNFVLRKPRFDTSSYLILWQIALIGDFTHNPRNVNKSGLGILVDFLEKYYDSNHQIFVYEAAQLAICRPIIQRVPLSKLATTDVHISQSSTLYIPPKISGTIDYSMADRLGISSELRPRDFHFSVKKLFRLKR